MSTRCAVVRECGRTPFRQIFWSRNGAPANIFGHRWNANTEAFRQIMLYSFGWPSISLFSGPPNARFGIKNLKKFPGVKPPDPLSRRRWPAPTRLHAVHGGASSPLLGPRSRKPFRQIKIYHYTPYANFLPSTSKHNETHYWHSLRNLWACFTHLISLFAYKAAPALLLADRIYLQTYLSQYLQCFDIVVWRQDEHLACKSLSDEVLVWLSGTRCRLFAYNPANATAIALAHHLLPHLNQDWFHLSGTGPGCPGK